MASPIPTGPPPTTTTSATSTDDFIADHSRARISGPAKGMSGYSSRLDPPRQSPDGGVRLALQPQLALSPRSNAVYAARDGAATTFCGDRLPGFRPCASPLRSPRCRAQPNNRSSHAPSTASDQNKGTTHGPAGHVAG